MSGCHRPWRSERRAIVWARLLLRIGFELRCGEEFEKLLYDYLDIAFSPLRQL